MRSSRAGGNHTSARPKATSSGSSRCSRCWALVDCPAIDGTIDEAEDVSGEVEDKDVLDAAIIAAGQAVEHYEITRYGSLITWAKRLGRGDVADVEGRESCGQEAHHHFREQGEPEGHLGVIRPRMQPELANLPGRLMRQAIDATRAAPYGQSNSRRA